MDRKVISFAEARKREIVIIGDYVELPVTHGVYRTNTAETGHSKVEVLETEENVNWLVSVDKNKEDCFITDNPVNNLTLKGIAGYLHASKVLNNACEAMYSCQEYTLKARSMMIEDVNAMTGYEPEKVNIRRYAYYPYGVDVSGYIEYKGNMYEKVTHEYEKAKFYTSDGGGVVKRDKHGKYRVPTKESPVFVTVDFYLYETQFFQWQRDAWLSSPCINSGWGNANFYMRCTSSSYVEAYSLYASDGSTSSKSYGIRPLISSVSELMLDLSEEWRDGSTPEKAWKFVKKTKETEVDTCEEEKLKLDCSSECKDKKKKTRLYEVSEEVSSYIQENNSESEVEDAMDVLSILAGFQVVGEEENHETKDEIYGEKEIHDKNCQEEDDLTEKNDCNVSEKVSEELSVETKKYHLVLLRGEASHDLTEEFEQMVNDFLNDGYELCGNIQISTDGDIVTLCREVMKKI